jgi:alpha-beta hydrolase superfamily lysophospholipase
MSTQKTADGVELNMHEWMPEGAPRLVLALLHGYGEHGARYAHVAKAMNAQGIGVVAADLRGHGKSSGRRGHVERFDEYHQDADATVARAKAIAGGAPVAIMGHSMGGLLVADWLIAGRGRDLAGVVLTSPFLGLSLKVNPVKEGVGRLMSKVIPTLALPAGLKGADVCRDPELARLYDTDPLNNKNATARWFTEAMKTMERVHARAGEIERPILLLYGGSDRVASADATDQFARKLSPQDKTIERLKDHYHEIVNELPEVRAKVIDRIAGWLVAHAPTKAA